MTGRGRRDMLNKASHKDSSSDTQPPPPASHATSADAFSILSTQKKSAASHSRSKSEEGTPSSYSTAYGVPNGGGLPVSTASPTQPQRGVRSTAAAATSADSKPRARTDTRANNPRQPYSRQQGAPGTAPRGGGLYPSLDSVSGSVAASATTPSIYPRLTDTDPPQKGRTTSRNTTKNNQQVPPAPIYPAVIPSPELLPDTRKQINQFNQPTAAASRTARLANKVPSRQVTPTTSTPSVTRSPPRSAVTRPALKNPPVPLNADPPPPPHNVTFSFGRPSNRHASLEDETPGPPVRSTRSLEDDDDDDDDDDGDDDNRNKFVQMTKAVAAVTSGGGRTAFGGTPTSSWMGTAAQPATPKSLSLSALPAVMSHPSSNARPKKAASLKKDDSDNENEREEDGDDGGNDSDDSELRRALLESSQMKASAAEGLDSQARETIQINTTTLRQVCEQRQVDKEVVDFCLQTCRQDQETLAKEIQRLAQTGDLEELDRLLQLNETVLTVLDFAKQKGFVLSSSAAAAAAVAPQSVASANPMEQLREETHLMDFPSNSMDPIPENLKTSGSFSSARRAESLSSIQPPPKPNLAQVSSSMEIGALVHKQDIFSLICMLRSQAADQRLDAAVALMKFARDEPRLKDEIHSSGGLHSLLTLFLRSTAPSIKLVSALAVAHILPASVVASAHNIKPQVGLKILECLRYLGTTVLQKTLSIRDEIISQKDCARIAAVGLTTFWIHALEPLLRKDTSKNGARGVDAGEDALGVPLTSLEPRMSSGSDNKLGGIRQRSRGLMGKPQRGREQSAGVQELLEMAVSLVIRFTTTDVLAVDTADTVLLVEQVCAMEAARPIAVREGILRVLVEWIRSDQESSSRTRPAAVLSLRHLTSIKDKYLAGWIHSQMVSSGALPAIVALTRDIHLSYPVRLAICQILSELCIAPHTRQAVVEANCIHFLIDLLYEYNNDTAEGLALYAAQALLQLAAGAMQRAGSLGNTNDKELMGFSSRERHDRILNDIVSRGAIASFVAIALEKRGELRMVAIETLGVLSEDISQNRGTRLQLCEDGAARALGETLTDSLSKLQKGEQMATVLTSDTLSQFSDEDLEQIYQALCALSNILDPTYEGTLSRSYSSPDQNELFRPKSLLIASCLQAIESGGVNSMLQLATFPLVESKAVQLVDETCHSLSLLSPYLLSKDIALQGQAGWAAQVLDVFCYIVKSLGEDKKESDNFGDNMDLHISVLQGIGALAKSAPLKVRIVDRVLPYVLRAKNSRDYSHVSNTASQAFQCLEFADDEVAVQTAGNNTNLLADWFCMQRSFKIQAMARSEIRQYLVETWGEAVAHANDPGLTKLARAVSGGSRTSISSSVSSDFMAQLGGDEFLEKDMQAMIREYEDMFGERAADALNRLSPSTSRSGDDCSPPKGLLSQQVYPLDCSQSETDWILDHGNYIANASSQRCLSNHVGKLLENCFPSKLLRERTVPVQMINVECPYNFRAILMPQRRYFSFRREGLLISRLCDKESVTSDLSEVHWTLNFTNSSFAGEFPESLVQTLYLCPTICALSFVGSSRNTEESDDSTQMKPQGGGVIANLVGSLPPWVSNLTLETVLDDQDMKALVAILETLGRLTAGQGLTQSFVADRNDNLLSSSQNEQTQGRFSFFAVRHSPGISGKSWLSFFSLLGQSHMSTSRITEKRPLSSLRCLDISGNNLGDELCAILLEIIHDKNSGCQIAELDLSGNRIAEGKKLLSVLTRYAKSHRSHTLSGVKVRGNMWKSTLQTLRLATNSLNRGKAWLEVIALLKHNTLELKILDLSDNNLFLNEDDYDSDIIVSSLLKNTFLQCLDLSQNRFSKATIDDILGQLQNVSNDNGLALLDLSMNSPSLNEHQEVQLESISRNSRSILLQRLNADRESRKSNELGLETSAEVEIKHEIIEERLSVVEEESNRQLTVLSDSSEPQADNKITVLFSAPLVFKDGSQNLRPFAKLDFEMERELLWQCLKEASRDIELSFDSATHDRLLATISKRCSCLHYSGHGNEHYLPFEDGKGGPNWFEVDDIKKLIGAREGDIPFRFVFVSACYSGLAGETFASAGVPHVVCCRQEFELKDAAALAFTRQFYLALAVGHTVKESFAIGCKAVRATPNLRDAEQEMEKFILLPKNGNHDVPIFDAKPVSYWPRSLQGRGGASFRGGRSRSSRMLNGGNNRGGELKVRNMIQEDPSPSPSQFFLGREVDMYIILNLLMVKRLVSVLGDVGVGRSSVACALCHYINERKSTMNQIKHIYYVKAKQGRSKHNRVRTLILRLVKKLIESEAVLADDFDKDADIETLFDIICRSLKNEKVLIVFDRTELLDEEDDSNEFPMLLSNLFRETRNVRVLLIAKGTLGIPSIGGQVEHFYRLGPLTFANSVRLFSSLCPYIHTPLDRRRLYNKMVSSMDEAELLPTDPGITESIRKKFEVIGKGIPSNIEKAAYTISKEAFMSLLRNDNGESDEHT